jgi:membrane-associated protein
VISHLAGFVAHASLHGLPTVRSLAPSFPSGVLSSIGPKSLITSFGLAGIFAILFAETGLLIGFFLPGDTLLALAGAFAGPHHTGQVHLPLVPLLIGCPVAAIVGAQVGHLIGVRGGHRLAKPGSSFEHSMHRIEPLLVRFGDGRAVFVCRFIPVLRTFINPAVGILGMGAKKFAVWNVAGGIVWTVAIVLAGRIVGQKLHIERYVFPAVALVIVLTVVSVSFEVARGKRRAKVDVSGGPTD